MIDIPLMFSILVWTGVVVIIVDFLLLYFKKVKTNTLWDYLLTAIGSALILASSIYSRLWPLIVLNSFWVAISILQIIKMNSKKRR